MPLDHGVVEALRCRFCLEQFVDVGEVAAGLQDLPVCVVVVLAVLVAGDEPACTERCDLVDGTAPGVDTPGTGFDEVLVDAVVDDVTGDDQVEVGGIQHAGVVGVAVPDLDDGQFVSFEDESVAEAFGGDGCDGGCRDLSGRILSQNPVRA